MRSARFGAAHVLFDHRAFDRDRRPAFVPEQDGAEIVALRAKARVIATRTLGLSVEVQRQADDQALHTPAARSSRSAVPCPW